jgi:hypothetical protein
MKRISGLQCAGSVALLLIVTGESTAADQLRGRANAGAASVTSLHLDRFAAPTLFRHSLRLVYPNDLTREAFRRSWLRRTTPACQTYP